MSAAALVGVAMVSPGHALQLECVPTDLQAVRHGQVLAESYGGWEAWTGRPHHSKLAAWFVIDSETVRATVRVRVRWWCDA